MKIVIDARFWGTSHTGLGVYTRELVEGLAKIDKKNDYTLLVRKENFSTITLPNNFKLVQSEARPYTIKEQLLLSWQIFRLAPDIVHFPSINVPVFLNNKYVVTVHDVIKHQSRGRESTTLPMPIYYLKYGVYKFSERFVLGRAKGVIVPSKTVKSEVEKLYPQTSGKTSVTYEAPTLDTKVAAPAALPEKFAIYTGNAYPHKNLERLLTGWEQVYKQTKLQLVISSGRSVFSDRLNKLIERKKAQKYVHYLGYLSDAQLVTAYKKATLYVFPSLMEGFGLPCLDAMSISLPVVCSDIPVFKEVYGNAVWYFDPNDPNDIAQKVIEVASSPKLQQELAKRGKTHCQKYSWDKLAKETLAIYESSASLRPS